MSARVLHTKRSADEQGESSRGKEHHDGKRFKNIWGEDIESKGMLVAGGQVGGLFGPSCDSAPGISLCLLHCFPVIAVLPFPTIFSCRAQLAAPDPKTAVRLCWNSSVSSSLQICF